MLLAIVLFVLQYVTDANFERNGLQPVDLLYQALSGLAHLHSLNIGKFFISFQVMLLEKERRRSVKLSFCLAQIKSKNYHNVLSLALCIILIKLFLKEIWF